MNEAIAVPMPRGALADRSADASIKTLVAKLIAAHRANREAKVERIIRLGLAAID